MHATLIAIVGLVTLTAGAQAGPKVEPEPGCTTAREFVTALEFLRAQKEFQIAEADARKLAEKVALGCTGAALRFARVTKVLHTAGMSANDSLRIAEDFVSRTDMETGTFIQVFNTAFSRDNLDLDIRSSVQMAQSLSTQFDGDVELVRKDFEALVDYCISSKVIDLPKPECASLAVKIARKGQIFNGGIAKTYIQAIDFLHSTSGPNLTTADALKVADQLMDGGPYATDNFITGFRYATATKGLALTNRDAVQFAYDLSTKNSRGLASTGKK